MRKFLLSLLTLALAFPVAAMAQDADEAEDEDREPTIFMVSSYQCANSDIPDIVAEYNATTKPVEEELVEEGMMASAGLYFHAWADEWNVNYYRVGYDIGEMIDAIAEVGARIVAADSTQANNPGAFAPCTAHKDNIYFLGPYTGDEDDDDDDGADDDGN